MSVGALFDGEDASIRNLGCNRECDGPATRAQVDHDGCAVIIRLRQRSHVIDHNLREELRFGARHKHPGANRQIKVAKIGVPSDVLKGFARRATLPEFANSCLLRG